MVFSDAVPHKIRKHSRENLMVLDGTASCGRCLMVHRAFTARKWLNYSALREPAVFSFICQILFALLP